MQKKKAKIFLQKHYECNSISFQNKLSMAHDSKELPTNHPQQTSNIQRAKQSVSLPRRLPPASVEKREEKSGISRKERKDV